MKTVPGVPESITRADYLALIRGAGFDTHLLRRLEFRMDGIYAEVKEVDEHGHDIFDSRDEPVVNTVYVPVRER